jgi:hypothetical protein
MEIQPSLLSKAVYGQNGRAALPLEMFIKKSEKTYFGGATNKKHLGVPVFLALVEINVNKHCHNNNNMLDYVSPSHSVVLNNQNTPNATVYEPISDEIYDTLINSVLDEHSEYPSEKQIEHIPKKYTRKIRYNIR